VCGTSLPNSPPNHSSAVSSDRIPAEPAHLCRDHFLLCDNNCGQLFFRFFVAMPDTEPRPTSHGRALGWQLRFKPLNRLRSASADKTKGVLLHFCKRKRSHVDRSDRDLAKQRPNNSRRDLTPRGILRPATGRTVRRNVLKTCRQMTGTVDGSSSVPTRAMCRILGCTSNSLLANCLPRGGPFGCWTAVSTLLRDPQASDRQSFAEQCPWLLCKIRWCKKLAGDHSWDKAAPGRLAPLQTEVGTP